MRIIIPKIQQHIHVYCIDDFSVSKHLKKGFEALRVFFKRAVVDFLQYFILRNLSFINYSRNTRMIN